jgi:hypothetical protein
MDCKKPSVPSDGRAKERSSTSFEKNATYRTTNEPIPSPIRGRRDAVAGRKAAGGLRSVDTEKPSPIKTVILRFVGIEAEMGSSQTCFKAQATAGAPEFGSAIFGLRAFQGATRGIVLMPAKRGVATDDRNRVAVQLAGLSFDRAATHCPLSFCPFERCGS